MTRTVKRTLNTAIEVAILAVLFCCYFARYILQISYVWIFEYLGGPTFQIGWAYFQMGWAYFEREGS